MPTRKGPFTVLSSQTIYKNPWIEVKEEKVLHDEGKTGIFGLVDYGSGVSIVALDNEQHIYVIKEYYYILEREGIQLPSGGIEAGETELMAAQKELFEETGIRAKTWKNIGYVDPLTMILKSPAYLFIATDLTFGEKTEHDIAVVKLPFKTAYQMVMDGTITHAPSCVAILKTHALLMSQQL